jgi:hypothetical protein
MNNNDEKILKLREQIAAKKALLNTATKTSLKTNLVLHLEEKTYNLNVLPAADLGMLTIRLNMYKISASDLKLTDVVISGYAIDDWLEDIFAKVNYVNTKAEKLKLAEMEKRLAELLSNDKKIELELSNLEKELG